MKHSTLCKVTTVLGFLCTTMTAPALAGGVAGGGGPPALEELQDMLQGGSNRARVFAWDENQLGLGVNADLQKEMLVTRTNDSQVLQLSNEDFERVADQPQTIQAVNLDGAVRSYQVHRTLAPDTLILVAPR